MDIKNIRNFTIIAHIDHGKSTLADRMLEVTGTIEKRKMKDQVLDSMDLERERGITIKMQPVRMVWNKYILNLIDTPGHIDFSYEVSRALKAVEGAILLIDSTQGIQAQTLTTLEMARTAGLYIIPVLSKTDSPLARISEIKKEVALLIDCEERDILETSGKTGAGVEVLLETIIEKISSPKKEIDNNGSQSLIFDFEYSNHTGVIVYVRVFDGDIKKGDKLKFIVAGAEFSPIDIGTFSPEMFSTGHLGEGEIGYIVTGIKRPGIASVGDTISMVKAESPALAGYMSPNPVVWASVYTESQDDFDLLRQALDRLKLSDSSFKHEEESSGLLGRGFRCGFLGMLHLEIVTERLKREFNLDLVVTTPSITYKIIKKGGKEEIIYSPTLFPEHGQIEKVYEPWVDLHIITPANYIGDIMQILFKHEAITKETEDFGDSRMEIVAEMPLRELMRNFFDELKSVSSGFASLSYKIGQMREAQVTRVDILVAEEIVPAFSRIVSKSRIQEESEKAVEKLANVLPRQMFTTKIQAKSMGRIISSKTLSAMRKDVTAHLYGGDITRKKKLLEKQKKGKKKMKQQGKVQIPQHVFIKMMKG